MSHTLNLELYFQKRDHFHPIPPPLLDGHLHPAIPPPAVLVGSFRSAADQKEVAALNALAQQLSCAALLSAPSNWVMSFADFFHPIYILYKFSLKFALR